MTAQQKQQTQPVVSIIMPTYNCLNFIEAAIDSIRLQSIQNYELLIADDASTDGTWDWLTQLSQQDSRIKPIKLSGVGPSRARNLCMEQAQADFLAFLDADDIWYTHKLAPQLTYMQAHPNVVYSFTDFRHVGINGTDLGGCFQYWSAFKKIASLSKGYRLLEQPLATIYNENVVGTSTVVMRKDVLQQAGGFDEELPSAEDWDFWLKLALHGDVAFTDQMALDYLMRPGSETSKVNKRLQAMEMIMQRYEADAVKQDRSTTRLSRARYLTAKAEGFRAEGEKLKAFIAHLKALMMKPDKRGLRSVLADSKALISP